MPAAKAKAKPSGFSLGSVPIVEAPGKPSASKLNSHEMALIDDYKTIREFEAVAKAGRLLIEDELKAAGSLMMVDFGVSQGKRPDNFIGTEGTSGATFVFSKRSTRSVLNEEEIALFAEHNIPVDVIEAPDTFSIPAKYIDDPEWRAKIEKAINTIADCPVDIIVQTKGTKTTTVSEASVDAIFAVRNPDIAAKFLPLVTMLGIKMAKSTVVTDINTLLTKAGRILGLPKLRDLMTTAINDPDAVLADDYGKPKKAAAKRK
jgi:hypothetical protein